MKAPLPDTSSKDPPYCIIVHLGVIQELCGQEEGEGASRKSMLGHVTKGRYHVKFPQLSTRWAKFGPCDLLLKSGLFGYVFGRSIGCHSKCQIATLPCLRRKQLLPTLACSKYKSFTCSSELPRTERTK